MWNTHVVPLHIIMTLTIKPEDGIKRPIMARRSDHNELFISDIINFVFLIHLLQYLVLTKFMLISQIY
jgi:hypothetical protein